MVRTPTLSQLGEVTLAIELRSGGSWNLTVVRINRTVLIRISTHTGFCTMANHRIWSISVGRLEDAYRICDGSGYQLIVTADFLPALWRRTGAYLASGGADLLEIRVWKRKDGDFGLAGDGFPPVTVRRSPNSTRHDTTLVGRLDQLFGYAE